MFHKPFKPMSKLLRIFTFLLLGTFFMTALSSCNDDDPAGSSLGTITGTVTDPDGAPISNVTVTVSGLSEQDKTATTDNAGHYTVEGVSLKLHTVTFAKTGWLTVSKNVSASSFGSNKTATVDATLINASAQITGTVLDARNDNAPLAGVTVSVGAAGTTQSSAGGTYTIENLIPDSYTVTFTKDGYENVTRQVTSASFIDGIATVNVSMGSQELLRGLTAADLADADKWYYNEYRGGRNADAYPHWDWACDYMCALDFRGAWQEQNEGTTLQIRNNGEDQSNPADLNMFDSYVFGSKRITADNKIMSLRLRTHNADAGSPAHFGVQVIDLSAAQPVAVKIGDNKTYAGEAYADFDFDLSAYVGKEVIIAVGIYRQATGDYWKQLVLRAIRFADVKVENWDWLPGTEVVAGWKLSQETARSTMPHTKKSFTGISTINGNRDDYADAYRSWRTNNHVAAEWHFVPLKKDPEVFPAEGYLIKTRSTSEVSTTVPEAYIYAKFAIASGSNQLTLKTRNFQSGSAPDHYTYFKLTAIKEDGTVTHIEPASNTAENANAEADGCWKFRHYQGTKDEPENFASFVYDLSQFNGSNVLLVFGVYNGAANTSENKLAFYSIDLN